MELKLVGKDGSQSSIAVSDSLFNRNFNEALVHQVIVSYLSNARSGTRAQKGRSEIAKSTRKPWRQKGTGRARAGMASSPIWRGGGKTFPNSPTENFKKKINKKMYRAGMSVIFSQLIRDQRLQVIEEFTVSSHKTRDFIEKIKSFDLEEVLIVTHQLDENLYRSSRNIPNIAVVEVKSIDPVSLLKFDNILITMDSLKRIEEQLT